MPNPLLVHQPSPWKLAITASPIHGCQITFVDATRPPACTPVPVTSFVGCNASSNTYEHEDGSLRKNVHICVYLSMFTLLEDSTQSMVLVACFLVLT